MSKIIVNGQEQTIDTTSIQLLDLIKLNDVQQPDMVSIQLNGEFVLRDRYETTTINDGDELDFLYFMGGGQR
ncbi:MAG: sulfur carrier protein ThiS [Bacteroidota bacterium]|nr:sulfur carrier protein ThiS [Bacteroidota bacterium]MDP4269320.1 sulfur carrier protein ThiS [Bacteroidota bacterium]